MWEQSYLRFIFINNNFHENDMVNKENDLISSLSQNQKSPSQNLNNNFKYYSKSFYLLASFFNDSGSRCSGLDG